MVRKKTILLPTYDDPDKKERTLDTAAHATIRGHDSPTHIKQSKHTDSKSKTIDEGRMDSATEWPAVNSVINDEVGFVRDCGKSSRKTWLGKGGKS